MEHASAVRAMHDALCRPDLQGGLVGDAHVAAGANVVFQWHQRGPRFAGKKAVIALEQVLVEAFAGLGAGRFQLGEPGFDVRNFCSERFDGFLDALAFDRMLGFGGSDLRGQLFRLLHEDDF